MLRVDTRRVQAGLLELLVSGTLDTDQVPVLDDALGRAFAENCAVSVNMSGTIGVDRAGLSALLAWSSRGARLIGCPPFLRRWIRDERSSRIRERS